jgi:muramidase (phage lysozyme)
MTREEKTFLDLVSYMEGTYGVGNNGYDVLINDGLDKGKSRVMKGWTNNTDIVHGCDAWYVQSLDSTVAGRYKFTCSTWKGINSNINVALTQANQDAAALKLLRQKLGANYDFSVVSVADMAIQSDKIKNTWSSFKTKSASDIYDLYKRAYIKYS